MMKVASGVILVMGLAIAFLLNQNTGMAEQLGEHKTIIEDLQYDLKSWEAAGNFWERRDTTQQKIVLQREQRNHQLMKNNNELKNQLRGITHEQDPCIKAVVSDDVLNILWDADAKAATELRGADADINPADAGTVATETR